VVGGISSSDRTPVERKKKEILSENARRSIVVEQWGLKVSGNRDE
jgi:hypothetical protein